MSILAYLKRQKVSFKNEKNTTTNQWKIHRVKQ